MREPKYTLADLPLGTRLRSLRDPNVIGEVYQHGETRGMDEVVVRWSNGKESLIWVHLMLNEKCESHRESQ